MPRKPVFHTARYRSPIGMLELSGTSKGISGLYFVNKKNQSRKIPKPLKSCIRQLSQYFKGKRKIFKLKLNPEGTEFQQKVWQELLQIPYAKTWTYRELAEKLGSRKLTRAVGNANAKNRISIIIPCHRVIGSNGGLVGYAGGLSRKEWLINFENNIIQGDLFE